MLIIYTRNTTFEHRNTTFGHSEGNTRGPSSSPSHMLFYVKCRASQITFDWIARLVAFLSSLQVFAIGSVMAKFPFSLATTYRAIRMASLYVRGLITKDDFYDGHQNLRCLTS